MIYGVWNDGTGYSAPQRPSDQSSFALQPLINHNPYPCHHSLQKKLYRIHMLQSLSSQCKEHKAQLEHSRFILINETQSQHSDFLIVGWLLSELAKQQPVTFIAFRENYAHFLSLSKKLGKSIEGYIKNKQLTYIQCFQSKFCSELPLTEVTPATYASPPSMVRKIYAEDLSKQEGVIKPGEVLIVDSVGFIDEDIQLCFWLYEQAMLHSCRAIFGGCLDGSPLADIFELEAEVVVRLSHDVGGFGKMNIKTDKSQSAVLWRNVNCKLEFNKHIAI